MREDKLCLRVSYDAVFSELTPLESVRSRVWPLREESRIRNPGTILPSPNKISGSAAGKQSEQDSVMERSFNRSICVKPNSIIRK